jgi:hypothetical protein
MEQMLGAQGRSSNDRLGEHSDRLRWHRRVGRLLLPTMTVLSSPTDWANTTLLRRGSERRR